MPLFAASIASDISLTDMRFIICDPVALISTLSNDRRYSNCLYVAPLIALLLVCVLRVKVSCVMTVFVLRKPLGGSRGG